jgi:hypothetical protein
VIAGVHVYSLASTSTAFTNNGRAIGVADASRAIDAQPQRAVQAVAYRCSLAHTFTRGKLGR